ncbi:MAG: HipA N-terminal domain-containing protein [Taibaiella sp.]|nr:HipA N-terminal domain-containing protein [Taibaiella sp.]
MRGLVFNNGILAGTIEKDGGGSFIFTYDAGYFNDKDLPPVSLTLLKTQLQHRSEKMFPFFYGLLSEGVNKDIQCSMFKIDEEDDFTRLLLTAQHDTIGAITVKPEDDEVFGLL